MVWHLAVYFLNCCDYFIIYGIVILIYGNFTLNFLEWQYINMFESVKLCVCALCT